MVYLIDNEIAINYLISQIVYVVFWEIQKGYSYLLCIGRTSFQIHLHLQHQTPLNVEVIQVFTVHYN